MEKISNNYDPRILFVLKKLPSCKTHSSNNYDPLWIRLDKQSQHRMEKMEKMKASTTDDGRSVGTYSDQKLYLERVISV